MGNVQSEQKQLEDKVDSPRAKVAESEKLQEMRQAGVMVKVTHEKNIKQVDCPPKEFSAAKSALARSAIQLQKNQLELEYIRLLRETMELERQREERRRRVEPQMEVQDVCEPLTNENPNKEREAEARRLQRKQEILGKVQEYGIDYVNYFNVAIIGLSGTGKSGFYNSITGHVLDDKVGLAETTMKPEFRTGSLDHGSIYEIRIWDIPGSGTYRFPSETYFEDMALFCYDFLIIVVGNRFTEWDVAMYKRAIHYKVNTVFIRSKSDQEVKNASEQLFELPFNALQPNQKQIVLGHVSKTLKGQFQLELSRCGLGTVNHFFVSAMAIIRKCPADYPFFDEAKFLDVCDKQFRQGKTRKINLDEIDIIA